ncbi:MAG: hypothetical protein Q9161_001558 [Pseudevernia consocians]
MPILLDDSNESTWNRRHHMFLLTLNNKLFLAPIKNPKRIMDVGTGLGIWASYELQVRLGDCRIDVFHIAPGGYIEHSEPTPKLVSDDSSVASGDIIHHCYELAIEATQKFGKDIMIAPFIRKRIEEAGFVNVVEKKYKWPLGEWPVDCKLKDIGRWNMQHWLEGIDAWTLRLLTQYCGVRQFPVLSAIS